MQINTRAFVYFLHNVMSNCDLHVDYGDIGKFLDTQLPHKLVKFWEEFSSISHIGPHQVTSFCCPATYILTLRPLPHSSACSAGGYFHSKQYPQVHMQCMLLGDIKNNARKLRTVYENYKDEMSKEANIANLV